MERDQRGPTEITKGETHEEGDQRAVRVAELVAVDDEDELREEHHVHHVRTQISGRKQNRLTFARSFC